MFAQSQNLLPLLPLLPLLLLFPFAFAANPKPYTKNCCSLSISSMANYYSRSYTMNIAGWGNSDAPNPICGEGFAAAIAEKCGVRNLQGSWMCYGSEGAPHDTWFSFGVKQLDRKTEADACVAEAWKQAGGPGTMSCSMETSCEATQCYTEKCGVTNNEDWGMMQ